MWAIHDEHDRVIGRTGVVAVHWPSRRAETFLILGEKDAWGKGYASEVMQVRSRYVFETLGLNRIQSEAFVENIASQKALEQVGYGREGLARQRYWRQGRWHDTLFYGQVAEDYFGRSLETEPQPAPAMPAMAPHRAPPMPAESLSGLAGERVRLVGLRKDLHLENYVAWLNDPLVTRTLHLRTPMTRLAEEGWFDRVAEGDPSQVIWAVHDEEGRHIGAAGLHGIDPRNRRATSGLFLGDRSAWGKGYASEAARLRTRFAFEELGLHRVESLTRADNRAIHRVLEKCGYRQEARLRHYTWREGRWRDMIFWGVLAEDWARLRS